MEAAGPGSSSLEAWRRYRTSGAIDARLLRPTVLRAWERCHDERVDPTLRVPEARTPADVQRLCEENAELIDSSTPYVDALAAAAGSARFATLLGVRDGTLLAVRGDAESMGGPDRAPGLGTRMDEQHAGANGIGSALVEETYVEFTASEHFIMGFHHHTCHGIPLRDARGEVAGALCLSVRAPSVAQRLRRLLMMASRGIQMELSAARLRRHFDALRGDPSEAAELLATLHQEVVQAHAAARLQIEVGARRLQDSGDMLIRAARSSIRRFERSARVWQLASGVPIAEPISTSELLLWAAELMRTDAAIEDVELSAEVKGGFGLVASGELARRVITQTEHAMRSVGERGAVQLRLVAGEVRICARSHDGKLTRDEPLDRVGS